MTGWRQRAAFWLALAALAFSTALLFSGWGDPGAQHCAVTGRDAVGRVQELRCEGTRE